MPYRTKSKGTRSHLLIQSIAAVAGSDGAGMLTRFFRRSAEVQTADGCTIGAPLLWTVSASRPDQRAHAFSLL